MRVLLLFKNLELNSLYDEIRHELQDRKTVIFRQTYELYSMIPLNVVVDVCVHGATMSPSAYLCAVLPVPSDSGCIMNPVYSPASAGAQFTNPKGIGYPGNRNSLLGVVINSGLHMLAL